MTDQHPITPPRELVKEWIAEIWHEGTPVQVAQSDLHLTARAAQWGADQELEACRMEIIDGAGFFLIDKTSDRVELADDLRNARRPKPPSPKRVALLQLDTLNADLGLEGKGVDLSQIRRALEALPDD